MPGVGVQYLMKEAILVSDRDRSPLVLTSILNHTIDRRPHSRIALVQAIRSTADIVEIDTSMRIGRASRPVGRLSISAGDMGRHAPDGLQDPPHHIFPGHVQLHL